MSLLVSVKHKKIKATNFFRPNDKKLLVQRIVPVEVFGWEEAFQAWTETATSVSGLLYHMWGRSLLGKHPKQRHKNRTHRSASILEIT